MRNRDKDTHFQRQQLFAKIPEFLKFWTTTLSKFLCLRALETEMGIYVNDTNISMQNDGGRVHLC
jgi:hypothetical protein